MEAQTQPQQPGQHPVGLAQPPQPYPQPPPYPGYPPPQSRRWMPYATLAAIVLAGALIAVAIVIAGGEKSHQAAPSAPTRSASVPTDSTQTCKAWRAADAAMGTIPALPEGWDWNTTGIDTLIANQKGAIEKTLSIFESKIGANDPQQVVEAAKGYIATKRTDLNKLTDHTITEADDAAVESSLATLQQLCTK
ncbi:MAG: hypothetical protein PHQ28_03015 [Mycobacterium sp.]|nr:hypothetical protein [Mycobacterium sp.]